MTAREVYLKRSTTRCLLEEIYMRHDGQQQTVQLDCEKGCSRGTQPPQRLKPRHRQRYKFPGLIHTSAMVTLVLLCMLSMLPSVVAQTTTGLSSSTATNTPTSSFKSLPTTVFLPPLNNSHPLLQLSLPSTSTSSLYLTFSICSLTSNPTMLPTVLISTSSPASFNLGSKPIRDASAGGVPTSSGGQGYNFKSGKNGVTWGLQWSNGFGNWTLNGTSEAQVNLLLGLGLGNDGRTLNTTGVGNGNVVPLNSSLSCNLTLIVIPTNSSPTSTGLDNSICAINAASANNSVSGVNNTILKSFQPEWMTVGGEQGFRSYWVLGDLTEQGNYTAWVSDDKGVLSQPAWFTTKSADFPCQLVMPNDVCPNLGYSAPLDANSTAVTSPSGVTISSTAPIQTLPDELLEPIIQNLEAFSTSLLSNACGRDLFSHVSSCLDCYFAYRDWLCRVVVPQCGTAANSSASATAIEAATSTSTSSGTFPTPSTILRMPSSPRNPSLPIPSYSYYELLPCMSTCNRADRSCPVSMGIRCPKRKVNAAKSYAFVGNDHSYGDGSAEQGVAAQDRWGNRWCNG
ncbi:calcium channel [Cryptococcus gattii E566]|uniref:Calcium channel, putative n=2 Tax=Cryptococcus gattii TaxID=37769 RepID=E6R0U5_CRYGW|nr:Calcium channel, putative [Cryptococcus gattii WM276]ADV20414.1 Calcium channel, putative [Cryptococcus gattii WM276]KIR77037.1 calcium channel [Cryptococcus gattii EJB2]KIY31539.1 calcium channel [Cryptococcus gattii E566]